MISTAVGTTYMKKRRDRVFNCIKICVTIIWTWPIGLNMMVIETVSSITSTVPVIRLHVCVTDGNRVTARYFLFFLSNLNDTHLVSFSLYFFFFVCKHHGVIDSHQSWRFLFYISKITIIICICVTCVMSYGEEILDREQTEICRQYIYILFITGIILISKMDIEFEFEFQWKISVTWDEV